MADPSPLSTARQAINQAINAWPETKDAFTTIYLFEGNRPDLEGNEAPEFGDMPALKIYPTKMPDGWKLNRMEKLDYFVALELWTAGFRYLEPEDLWPKVRRALWQGSVDGITPIIKSVTGFYPNDGGIITFEQKRLGDTGGPAIKSLYVVHLWINDDPLGN